MVRKGKNFELLIEKIETLKNIGAEIKSPEFVLDSDTNTRREVDIGIRFKNSPLFIAFECREHKNIQNIQFIEYLIAKKKSINADVLIAVSASSFTKPAKIKAFKNGIIIRNIENISAEDILTLKETSYLEVSYISDLTFAFDSTLLYDSDTKTNPKLEFVHLKNCFIHNKQIDEKIPFVNFINDSAIDGILKIENLDRQKNINGKIELKHSNLLLWPFDYDIKALKIIVNAKIEKIKYPLVSIKEYKDSITYDLLGQLQEYGIENNSFLVDKPSDTSSWEVDLRALQKPNKILFSSVVYNENPTILKNVKIRN